MYGQYCEKRCPSNCTDWCRKKDGWCPQCKNGYQGDDCNQACAAPCATCEKLTGRCLRCHNKIQYGDKCDKQCGEGCGSSCNKNGECSSCKNGFYGYGCELKCSPGCQDEKCGKSDGLCRCKARHHLTQSFYCIPCPKNCLESCTGTLKCDRCKPGYFGDRCQNTCSPHCNEECNRNNGTCQCKVGYAGTPCQECPVNCESGCDSSFRCQSCKPGFYGDSCNTTCPAGCKNGDCKKEGGCSPCKEGYAGPWCEPCPENCFDGCDENVICRSCKEKFYGDFCNKSCPLNCLFSCSKDQGLCHHCVAGYKGEKCQESKCKY